MGEGNVLTGGIEVLNQVKENLLELEGYKQKIVDLAAEQERLEKLITQKEKQVESEIVTTTSKRQEEVEGSFDGQIDKTRSRIKKVKTKRDKFKDAKISERIELETADLREERRGLVQDLKAVFKIHQIPRIFNTEYFFSMYMPSEVGDFLVILLSIIIMLAVPAGIFFLIPAAAQSIWVLILLYLAVIIIGMAMFVLIFKNVKTKHAEALREAKQIRAKIDRTKKRAKLMIKAIKKDTDESRYGLDKYDNEIKELEQQVVSISDEKKNALTTFENQTKKDIIAEIKSRYDAEIAKLKQDCDTAYTEQRRSEEKVNAFVLEMSKNYEAYLGKEILTIPMIDSLIEIINTGDALTIADAMVCYKKQTALETQK